MKKYLLSVFAVILAVGFSAFTKAPAIKKSSTDYYWYEVDHSVPGGRVLSNNGYLYGGAIPQAEAQENEPCDQGNAIDCLWGFEEPLPPNQTILDSDMFTRRSEF